MAKAIGTSPAQIPVNGMLGSMAFTEVADWVAVIAAINTSLGNYLGRTENAVSATKLFTPRAIGGVLFDGTAAINLPGVNVGGNQNTTGNAATATLASTPRFSSYLNSIGDISDADAAIANGGFSAGWLLAGATGGTGIAGTLATFSYSATTSATQVHIASNGTMRVRAKAGAAAWQAWRVAAFTDSDSTGNAASATRLQTPRAINGVAFDGTAAVSIPSLSTAIGSGDLDTYLTPGDYYIPTDAIATSVLNTPVNSAGALEVNHANWPGVVQTYTTYHANNQRKIYQRARLSTGAFGVWTRIFTEIDPPVNITGNAATATRLATPRAINGANFDGTSPITTALWGAARNLTLGSSAKSVNGSTDVAYSLAEMGAYPASGTTAGTVPLTAPSLNGGALGGLRNRLINGDKRINQRGFNGTWSSIADGAYGYDRWKRSGTSNMAQVVEAGNFKPSTVHTLSGTGIATSQITSPASGNWTVIVPQAATNLMLEEGTIATPFELPDAAIEMIRCQQYGEAVRAQILTNAYTADAYCSTRVDFAVTKRATPTITYTAAVGPTINSKNASVDYQSVSGFRFLCQSTSAGPVVEVGNDYFADAEL